MRPDPRTCPPLLGLAAPQGCPGTVGDMTELTPLHEELLELGMEDVIPLWEIISPPEARHRRADEPSFEEASEALIDLMEQGRIRVLSGPWHDNDPAFADPDAAKELLRDRRRYSSAEEIANDLDRVYFVNVENLVDVDDDQ